MSIEKSRVVLCRPSESRNIGAACRAMKNCGLTELVVVADTQIDVEPARPLAVGAADLLDRMTVAPSLEEATRGTALVAGVTRRLGKRRKMVSFTPWKLAARVAEADGPVSIVFGNEQSGLSDEELEHCHMAVSIPTAPDFPSLNLSHAVQIICYELYLARLGWPGRSRTVPGEVPAQAGLLTSEEVDEGVASVVQALNGLGFLTQPGPQGMPALLREIMGRAMISRSELERLVAMFRKIEGMSK